MTRLSACHIFTLDNNFISFTCRGITDGVPPVTYKENPVNDVGVGMAVQVVLYSAVRHVNFGRGFTRFSIQHVDTQALPVHGGKTRNGVRIPDNGSVSGWVRKKAPENVETKRGAFGGEDNPVHAMKAWRRRGWPRRNGRDVVTPTPRCAPSPRVSSDRYPPGLATYPN